MDEIFEKVQAVVDRYDEISELISDPDVISDTQRFMALSKEEGSLRETVETFKRYKEVVEGIEGNEEMLNEGLGDAELEEMAKEEAGRCLNCKNPKCVEGCPVNVRIPEFIHKVAEGDFKAAYEIITSTNALPALSGRVCPQESQCESKCVRGVKGEPVAIGRLERFVADWYRENVNTKPEKTPPTA